MSEFVSYTPYTIHKEICLGDSRPIPSLGEGTVCLSCIVNQKTEVQFIHNIQYVPGLSYSLLSCRVLLRRGLKVILEDDACKVFHKDGTLIIESIPSSTQLFFIRTAARDSAEPLTNQTANVATPSFDLIHKRLAHPGKDALEQMIRNVSVLGLENVQGDARNFDCIACIQGKMTRAPFQSGHHTATTRFGRIHSDICGPMEVISLGKNWYFSTLVDDYTHYMWFHPCKSKADFTPWFILMDKLFVNQYGSHVKILQSDGGGEYVNNTLRSYCDENGISVELTVPHTPEQNGVAERANQKILDKGCTIMKDAGAPEFLWAEAFATAVYAIN